MTDPSHTGPLSAERVDVLAGIAAGIPNDDVVVADVLADSLIALNEWAAGLRAETPAEPEPAIFATGDQVRRFQGNTPPPAGPSGGVPDDRPPKPTTLAPGAICTYDECTKEATGWSWVDAEHGEDGEGWYLTCDGDGCPLPAPLSDTPTSPEGLEATMQRGHDVFAATLADNDRLRAEVASLTDQLAALRKDGTP